MTRGPTSRVTISSVSPLLSRRLFFQPLYSTFSTVTLPFSSAAMVSGTAAMIIATIPVIVDSWMRMMLLLSFDDALGQVVYVSRPELVWRNIAGMIPFLALETTRPRDFVKFFARLV